VRESRGQWKKVMQWELSKRGRGVLPQVICLQSKNQLYLQILVLKETLLRVLEDLTNLYSSHGSLWNPFWKLCVGPIKFVHICFYMQMDSSLLLLLYIEHLKYFHNSFYLPVRGWSRSELFFGLHKLWEGEEEGLWHSAMVLSIALK
jgi:hypothetical protein